MNVDSRMNHNQDQSCYTLNSLNCFVTHLEMEPHKRHFPSPLSPGGRVDAASGTNVPGEGFDGSAVDSEFTAVLHVRDEQSEVSIEVKQKHPQSQLFAHHDPVLRELAGDAVRDSGLHEGTQIDIGLAVGCKEEETVSFQPIEVTQHWNPYSATMQDVKARKTFLCAE